jgi:MFS family permease
MATFAVVSTSLILIFMASGTPVPLYNTYRVTNGITDAGLAITTVTYLTTTALSLLLLGRLSDHIGRRPMAIGAVIAAIAGCLVLTQVETLPVLMTGRVLQGLACGVASAALGSYVIDTAPARPTWLAAVLTSVGPSTAIPVGALISGILAEHGPAPRTLVYLLLAAALTVCGVLLVVCAETMPRTPGAMASLRPRVHIPAGQARLVLAAGAGLVATWSLAGFYQAFAPALTADRLGTDNAIAIAAVFSSVVVLGPVGGSLTGRLRATTALRIGLIGFVIATAVILATLHARVIVPFLIVSVLASLCQGTVNTGGMRAVLDHATPIDRAGLLSTLYLISYGGAALPRPDRRERHLGLRHRPDRHRLRHPRPDRLARRHPRAPPPPNSRNAPEAAGLSVAKRGNSSASVRRRATLFAPPREIV